MILKIFQKKLQIQITLPSFSFQFYEINSTEPLRTTTKQKLAKAYRTK